jgi:flagellar biosynthesis protein FliQ
VSGHGLIPVLYLSTLGLSAIALYGGLFSWGTRRSGRISTVSLRVTIYCLVASLLIVALLIAVGGAPEEINDTFFLFAPSVVIALFALIALRNYRLANESVREDR